MPPTPLDRANHSRVSTSAEISDYLAALVAETPGTRLDRLGSSEQERPIEALVFAAEAEASSPPRLKIMIVGSQHGAAEPAGGEAMLVIARELAAGALKPLLDDVDVVLIPNANPDGRDLKRRANANWININTDFVLATQAETRVLKGALHRYAPDALLDSHESAILKRQTLAREGFLTDFDAQIEIANNPAVPAALRSFALDDLLPALTRRVTEAGLPAHRYIGEITSTSQPITNGGLTVRNFRNTAGLGGTLSFLVETKLDSREDTFPTYRNIAMRVARQLTCLRAFLTLMHERRSEILARVAAARAALRTEPVTLYAGYVRDEAHPEVDIPMRRLDTRDPVTVAFRDHRAVVTADTLDLPSTYLITRHVDEIRPALDRHGIRYQVLAEPMQVEAIAERFAPQANVTARVTRVDEERVSLALEPGMLVIDLAQPDGRLVPLLLDPRSTSSLFRYPEFASLIEVAQPHFVYRAFKGAVAAR